LNAIYFFSGFDAIDGFTNEIASHLINDIVNHHMLLFISSSPSGHEKSERYKKGSMDWFEKIGISFNEYNLLDDRVDTAKAMTWINSASCIFLMGGDTLAQIVFLKTHGLIEAIRNTKAVVIGLSAGGINMAKTSVCSKDKNNPETVIYKGIGLADVTIDPHFSPDNLDLISELKTISWQHLIYAMCDNSGIIVKNDSTFYIGEIYRIHNALIERVE